MVVAGIHASGYQMQIEISVAQTGKVVARVPG
jgi:hypothetical protein